MKTFPSFLSIAGYSIVFVAIFGILDYYVYGATAEYIFDRSTAMFCMAFGIWLNYTHGQGKDWIKPKPKKENDERDRFF